MPGFQSTLPRRERRRGNRHRTGTGQFQSTLPRRERLVKLSAYTFVRHFNPRSREGSDRNYFPRSPCHRISIHAPAKGATCGLLADNMSDFHFNPRSREGSDQAGAQELFPVHPISIHAPAKGATQVWLTDTVFLHFNPRSREGSDIIQEKREAT